MTDQILPFHTFLWKIVSRCNLDCSYCYVYNSADSRWREQPKLMSETVARQTARRMREHLDSHGKKDAVIVLHGGEPLLGGVEHLEGIARVIGDEFAGAGIRLSVGTQSNLLLFTEEIGELYLRRQMSIGVSIDGPPEVNDIFRVDHRGRPSSKQLEQKLALLTSSRYRTLFSGFLCVINPMVDPIVVTRYLMSYQPPSIDFLFPLDNHVRRPLGKSVDRPDATPYGDWLIRAFDFWCSQPTRTDIRIFMSMIRMIFGAPTLVESLGLLPVDLIVIEANGDIEGVDSLKATFNGATQLGYNVERDSFDRVAQDISVRSRQNGANGLCRKCQECGVVEVCGGGYLPHRYSLERGFDNPSVYCADLEKLIRHIHRSLVQELPSAWSGSERTPLNYQSQVSA